MAPVMPFFAEDLYQRVRIGEGIESVHLCEWPEAGGIDEVLLKGMKAARAVTSLALEAREKESIKIRQPLALLEVKENMPRELQQVVKEEVNVKEVRIDQTLQGDIRLDTTLTPELREEGTLRNIIRLVQERRKEEKLQIVDRPRFTFVLAGEEAAVAKKYREKIMTDTGLEELTIEES